MSTSRSRFSPRRAAQSSRTPGFQLREMNLRFRRFNSHSKMEGVIFASRLKSVIVEIAGREVRYSAGSDAVTHRPSTPSPHKAVVAQAEKPLRTSDTFGSSLPPAIWMVFKLGHRAIPTEFLAGDTPVHELSTTPEQHLSSGVLFHQPRPNWHPTKVTCSNVLVSLRNWLPDKRRPAIVSQHDPDNLPSSKSNTKSRSLHRSLPLKTANWSILSRPASPSLKLARAPP